MGENICWADWFKNVCLSYLISQRVNLCVSDSIRLIVRYMIICCVLINLSNTLPVSWFIFILNTYLVVFQAERSSVFSQNPAVHFWGEQLRPNIIHLKPAGLCFHLPPGSVWSPPLHFSPCCGCPVINDRITRDHQPRRFFSLRPPTLAFFSIILIIFIFPHFRGISKGLKGGFCVVCLVRQTWGTRGGQRDIGLLRFRETDAL